MPIRLIFSLIFLFSLLLIGQAKTTYTVFDELKIDSDTIDYKCPPCGCEYENDIFDLPGECPACGMMLVPINSGIAAALDQKIAPLFYSAYLIKLYTKILYPIFLVGILFSLFSLIQSYFKNSLNIFLIGVILILSLYGFKSQLYGVGYQLTDNVKSLFTPISLISLLGPFIFFHVKTMITPSYVWKKTDNLHFLPAFILVILYTIGFLMPEKNSVHFMASPFEVIISHAEQTWSAIMGLVYLFFSFKIYKKWNKTKEHNHTTPKTWLVRFMIGMSLLCSFWVLLIFINYWLYNFGVATVSNYPLWISFGLSLLWIGGEILLNPILISSISPVPKSLNFNGDIPLYKKKLEGLMVQQKIFKDQNLSLEKLAESMDLNPRYLSSFLNQIIGKNFYEFINFYRIAEVKQLLQDSQNSHLTIEAIAQKAGFKSKSTFNTAFKKSTSMTPRQFLKQRSKA